MLTPSETVFTGSVANSKAAVGKYPVSCFDENHVHHAVSVP